MLTEVFRFGLVDPLINYERNVAVKALRYAISPEEMSMSPARFDKRPLATWRARPNDLFLYPDSRSF